MSKYTKRFFVSVLCNHKTSVMSIFYSTYTKKISAHKANRCNVFSDVIIGSISTQKARDFHILMRLHRYHLPTSH